MTDKEHISGNVCRVMEVRDACNLKLRNKEND